MIANKSGHRPLTNQNDNIMSVILCKKILVSEGTTNVTIDASGICLSRDKCEWALENPRHFTIEITRDECRITFHYVYNGKCYEEFVYSCKNFIIRNDDRNIKEFFISGEGR